MNNIKIKYILSVIIDIIIVDLLVIKFLIRPVYIFPDIITDSLPIIFLIFFLLEDKIFFGNSIGKWMLGIRLIPDDEGKNRVTILQVIIRRVLEIFFAFRILIWGLEQDLTQITSTRIVNKSDTKI